MSPLITCLSIIGTRPEAIKMAPVIQAMRAQGDQIRCVVCVTGQHRQMLDQVLELFKIKPDYDLSLMTPDQSLGQLTARLLSALDPVLTEVEPDWVLAQGDTTTVMATALLCFYRDLRFAHVEAGLRTADRRHPFPEEINRRIADLVADVYFAPTPEARGALLAEGCPAQKVLVTGNTVIDALLEVAARPYDWSMGQLSGLPDDRPLVTITAHRRESFGQPFCDLCKAIATLAGTFTDHHFVYPVHLNPNVRQPVYQILGRCPNVSLIEPLDYASLVHLLKRSRLVLTDSGGIQEEAPSLKVPVLVMRQTTERPEGVEAGVARLVGTDPQRIVSEASTLLSDPQAHDRMATGRNPYGDGQAARRIVDYLLNQSEEK